MEKHISNDQRLLKNRFFEFFVFSKNFNIISHSDLVEILNTKNSKKKIYFINL